MKLGTLVVTVIFSALGYTPAAISGDLIVGETAEETGARRVFLVATENPGVFADPGTGEVAHMPPVPVPVSTSHGGLIAWQQYREITGRSGLKHVFYQQHYKPPREWIVFPGEGRSTGIPVAGGYLSYHFNASGKLYLVSGAQFDDVLDIVTPVLTDSETALVSAFDAAARHSIDVRPLHSLSSQTVNDLLQGSELRLLKSQGEAKYGLAWDFSVVTKGGGTPRVTIDASDGRLIAKSESMNWSPQCGPASDAVVAATLRPQNLQIGEIPLSGTERVFGSWDCVDAHAPQTGTTPDIQVLRGDKISSCDSALKYIPAFAQCIEGFGPPRYDNIARPNFFDPSLFACSPGRAVGDALRHAKTTFEVFSSTLGRQGVYGSGTPFRIVVDGRCDPNEYEPFEVRYSPDGSDLVPAGGVLFCGSATDLDLSSDPTAACDFYNQNRSYSAALDVLAHEIGHGVIHSTVGWGGQTDLEKELHEGFADIIGHGVEWIASNPYPENPDWMGGEDKGAYDRRVDQDEGHLKLFRTDDQHDGSPHARGSALPAAFRLLAEGGNNPACGGPYNQPPISVCAKTVTGVGVTLAFQTYYKMLDVYAVPSTDWPQFAGLVIAAAGEVEDNSAKAVPQPIDPIEIGGGVPIQTCVTYSPLRYAAWRSMAAVGWGGSITFCSYPD